MESFGKSKIAANQASDYHLRTSEVLMTVDSKVMKSAIAGQWYTGNPTLLAREIDAYLDAADVAVGNDAIALLLPHAGYTYSGLVAARGYRQVMGRTFSRVVILGPSHRVALGDVASIPAIDAIETPLGTLRLDVEMVRALGENSRFRNHPFAHDGEHSVQIHLPFIQRVLGNVPIVPILCGHLSEDAAIEIADALLDAMDSDTLVVVSSDFTHYGRGFDYVPFTENIPGNLRKLDMDAYGLIEKKDLSGFNAWQNGCRFSVFEAIVFGERDR